MRATGFMLCSPVSGGGVAAGVAVGVGAGVAPGFGVAVGVAAGAGFGVTTGTGTMTIGTGASRWMGVEGRVGRSSVIVWQPTESGARSDTIKKTRRIGHLPT